MKKYRKVLVFVGVSVGVVFLALIISAFLFKDKIIRQFVTEANKHLNTPIKVGKIDVSVLRHFPKLSIVISDVYVEDSHPAKYPLFTADKLSFMLNPFEVSRGKYVITGVAIEGCEADLKIDEHGVNNYTVLKEASPSNGTSTLTLDLNDVQLRDVKVRYFDLRARQELRFLSDRLTAGIKTDGEIFDIKAKGRVTTDTILIRGTSYLAGKTFEVKSTVRYDDKNRHLTIHPSSLLLHSAAFDVEGSYEWRADPTINLALGGKNTDIQTILSLLPESVSNSVRRYESDGDVYFNAQLEGAWNEKSNPSFDVNFGFSDAEIYHPEFKTRIEKATMKGSFSIKDITRQETAVLSLSNISGKMNGQKFDGAFLIRNFNDPYIDCTFKGKLDAAAVHGFYPINGVKNPAGSLTADIALKGRVGLLKSKSTAQQVVTQGTIDLEGINLLYGKKEFPLKNLSGNLQFSNNDLALSNVAGNFGNTDFVLNGFFKNIITYVLFEDQAVGIEADLKSKLFDLNQIFEFYYGNESTPTSEPSDSYKFQISKNVYLNFNCDVAQLRYKRFTGRKIKGDLLVKNKVAVSRKLELQTMGGGLTLSGIVDSNNPKAIDVTCTSRLNNIDLDSVFYVFENFDQTFIQDKHLKGKVTADVNFEMTLNEKLRLFPETLIADIGAVIKKGELNNFEPMKKLNKYLDDEGLSNLRFSDIKNDIHIENKTIYIPQMLVSTNVTDIRLSGTHTFDQKIDYRVVTPLRGKRNSSDREASSAIGLDEKGQSRLFLKITGTTDDYRIQYDTESVRKKIASDIKNEVKELRDAFKNKETQKKKDVELQEDEYFDW